MASKVAWSQAPLTATLTLAVATVTVGRGLGDNSCNKCSQVVCCEQYTASHTRYHAAVKILSQCDSLEDASPTPVSTVYTPDSVKQGLLVTPLVKAKLVLLVKFLETVKQELLVKVRLATLVKFLVMVKLVVLVKSLVKGLVVQEEVVQG